MKKKHEKIMKNMMHKNHQIPSVKLKIHHFLKEKKWSQSRFFDHFSKHFCSIFRSKNRSKINAKIDVEKRVFFHQKTFKKGAKIDAKLKSLRNDVFQKNVVFRYKNSIFWRSGLQHFTKNHIKIQNKIMSEKMSKKSSKNDEKKLQKCR